MLYQIEWEHPDDDDCYEAQVVEGADGSPNESCDPVCDLAVLAYGEEGALDYLSIWRGDVMLRISHYRPYNVETRLPPRATVLVEKTITQQEKSRLTLDFQRKHGLLPSWNSPQN
jgi:hypothetical protein